MPILEDLLLAVETQSAKIDLLREEVRELQQKVAPSREIFTLRDLAELPEAPSLKTMRNRPELQPNRGQADGYRGAQKAWRAETVEAWRRQLSPLPETAFPHLIQQRRAQ